MLTLRQPVLKTLSSITHESAAYTVTKTVTYVTYPETDTYGTVPNRGK